MDWEGVKYRNMETSIVPTKDKESLNQGWISDGGEEEVVWVRVKENQWDH